MLFSLHFLAGVATARRTLSKEGGRKTGEEGAVGCGGEVEGLVVEIVAVVSTGGEDVGGCGVGVVAVVVVGGFCGGRAAGEGRDGCGEGGDGVGRRGRFTDCATGFRRGRLTGCCC